MPDATLAAPGKKPRLKYRSLREIGQLAVVVIGATLSAMILMRALPAFQNVELWTSDIRMIRGQPTHAPDPDIVVATITERVLDQFPYRSPVDRAFLARVINGLAAKHVRAIGLDVLFDKPTEPAKDELLRQTLKNLKVPISVSFVQDPRLIDAPGLAYLRNFVPPEERGMANLVTTSDGTVRSIYDGEMSSDGSGLYIPGLARAILKRIGISTQNERPLLDYLRNTTSGDKAIREYSAAVIPFLPERFLAGKIVLIGADLDITDRDRTPLATLAGDVDGKLAGVVIHAHGLSELLHHRYMKVAGTPVEISLIIALAMLGTLLGRLPMPIWGRLIASAVVVALYVVGIFWIYWFTEWFLPVFPPILGFVVAVWITDIMVGRESRVQKAFIQREAARFTSPKVVAMLMENPDSPTLTGARREMSFLFTDVAGFTSLAERQGPEQLIALLNEYLTGVCKIIMDEYDGTVCRFVGDAIFALWNAPADQPDHRQRAFSCALAIDAYAEKFRAEKRLLGVEFGATRIGINTGEAMAGFLGATERREYTALGDNVNLASRLESINKYFSTRIAISESVAEGLPAGQVRPIAKVVVKGKGQPVKIFEPIGVAAIEADYAARYEVAYALVCAEDSTAQDAFERLVAENPSDGPAKFHLNRLREGKTSETVIMEDK